MQALEYYFNPRLKPDTKFGVFSFRPPETSKNHLGNLYLVFEFTNSISKDKNFPQEISEIINKEFYLDPKRTPEKSLTEALKKINQFLEQKSSNGEVGWLGNLNMAVMNLSNSFLHFSRSGNIRILLLRGDELTEINEDMEFLSGSMLKTFSNIASGRLFNEDKIMILNQSLVENFYDSVFSELINLPRIDDKSLKKFFRTKKQEMKGWSGVFFVLFLTEKGGRLKFLYSIPNILSFRINKEIFLLAALFFLLFISYLIYKL